MSQKIGVITTGGTIGSILSGDTIAVDPAGRGLRREIDALCQSHGFDVRFVTAFNKNSEDLTPRDWARLIRQVEDMLSDGVTRIVVTHGTDTLAYSAAALALVFGGRDARICLTGSFRALDAADSDGPLNLLAAFHTVVDDAMPTGVTVAFRSDVTNEAAYVYAALDVKAMSFDETAFASVDGRVLARFTPASGLAVSVRGAKPPKLSLDADVFDTAGVASAGERCLLIHSYPGLTYNGFDFTRFDLVVVGLYHSGTAPSDAGPGSLRAALAQTSDMPPVIAATYPSAHVDVPYESTARLKTVGVHIVKDVPVHVVYVYAVLALAAGATGEEVAKQLQNWVV